jgi:hypothetical protein
MGGGVTIPRTLRLFFGARQHKKAATETLQILPAVKSN